MHNIEPMIFSNAVLKYRCHICDQVFKKTDIIVRDHCHFTGIFRGFAHNTCNLQYQKRYFIPVIIHNLKGYDSHLILKQLSDKYAKSIRIIPVNSHKFTTFQIDQIKFLDSFQFLSTSLSTLVENLENSNHSFPIFKQFYSNEKSRFLLKRKGVFPYSYFSSPQILKETCLPPKAAFFNILTNSHVKDEDYEFALLVFQTFKCKNFADYLKLYQQLDVVLLAEVFTSFRQKCLLHYKLDPCHFITAADLTWNAGLKFTKVELELFTDINMYIWIENNIRGGICFVGKRYASANNPFIPKYNKYKEESYIIAVDANNLYGYAMSQPLPIGNFFWLSKEEVRNFDVSKLSSTDVIGYFLEVDIFYPASLHDLHDFPLAADHLTITYDMLSPYQKKLIQIGNIHFPKKNRKLTPSFTFKTNFVVHYLNLKFYLQKGLILKKIHRILGFKQENWLESYVGFNNEKRMSTQYKFEKDLFKLMNNAWFGKSLQNPRKRVNIEGAFNLKQCKKKLSSPLLEYFKIINENFAIFKLMKRNLHLDKPIYIGFTILELSKLHIYKLYYNYFKQYYGEKCSLLYTDTDSLYLEIKAHNVYTEVKNNFSDIMDYSNYPKDHDLFNLSNEGRLGALKNETCEPIKEFVALKCKMYCMVFGDNSKKTAKGLKKSCVQDLNAELYKSVLNERLFLRHKQNILVTKDHDIKTVTQNKIGLTPFYDKKYLLDDGINCYPFGHYAIDETDEE
ncbi:c2H2-type domain-containing protein [Trichonephila clavata]|uniref:C2H2-type domain-containing protein n=1 Tax=Trichonephila clavata TaxID=2740835 RepID=A0A8X6HGW7_TRICU|nr:c2H2-type domain-containing protein [Trichonephila clavata]